ncbi:MAG: hypothetical protein JNK65_06730 [Deltaproteobacteria bacterium]|nr:hypothetical protein [Deltaproteobacteria bacterium]
MSRIIKLVVLLAIVAVALDLHYQGRSARDYAKEYGLKLVDFVYTQGKSLVGKDLSEMTPKTLSDLPKHLKLEDSKTKQETVRKDSPVQEKQEDKKEIQVQKKELTSSVAESIPSTRPVSKPASSKNDQLTNDDRESLKKLLEEKNKK